MTSYEHNMLVRRFLGIAFILLSCIVMHSQQLPPSGGITSTDKSLPSTQPGAEAALPADRIIELLHEKPELMIDLKKLAAEQLQAQGIPVQEDSITDEMLLGKIVSDASVRSNITLWLRARGYISATDIEQSRSGVSGSDDSDAQQERPSTRIPIGADGGTSDLLSSRTDLTGLGLSSGTRYQSDTPDSEGDREAENRRSGMQSSRSSGKQGPSQTEAAPPGTPELLHRPAPLNLLAMRDLYTQVPDQNSSLKRFGSDVFLSRGIGAKQVSIDLPVGPDYVLGPGDGINIDLWGGLTQQFTRTVDREGRVVLPEGGPVVVAGLTLEQTQKMIQSALADQFRDARVEVSVTRLRTVRVYVVGDVQRPGAYDVSSLSTPLNALYAAGGPTAVGSLRTVRHYRGKQLIRDIDLYEFLLQGVRSDSERLQPGDTILVPPAGAQITIAGMVRRPAIYELRTETKLSEVLTLAGGALVSAQMREIKVERIQAHDKRITVDVSTQEASSAEASWRAVEAFTIQDGDRVVVAPILPYSERSVYVDGHVVRPGKYAYRDNMSLNDIIRSYQDILPEPSERGEIIRLRPPDYRPETIEFNLPQVLIGNQPVALQPFDTVRLFGRYEVDAPMVAVRGEVRRPGQYPLPEGLTAAQLVRMAGGLKRSALRDAVGSPGTELEFAL